MHPHSASQGVMGKEWEVVVVALGQSRLRECLAFSRWLSLPRTPGPSPGPEVPSHIARSIPIVEVRTRRPKGAGACARSHTGQCPSGKLDRSPKDLSSASVSPHCYLDHGTRGPPRRTTHLPPCPRSCLPGAGGSSSLACGCGGEGVRQDPRPYRNASFLKTGLQSQWPGAGAAGQRGQG